MKQYLKNISLSLSTNELSDNWKTLEKDQKEAIEEFISEKDPNKYLELLKKVSDEEITKLSTTTRDGILINAEGLLSENLKIDAYKTNSKKTKIIEDKKIGLIENDEIQKIERIFSYDISIEKDNKNINLENKVVITLNDIKATKDKKYIIYHLLDEEKSIKKSIEDKTVKKVTSDKFNDYFTKELKASNEENTIYVKELEAYINDDESISFATDSFSTFYIVEYTVDFHYNGKVFNMQGSTSMLLSELFKKLNIEKEIKDVTNVTFSDETLLEIIKQEDGDWLLKSLQPFQTTEELIITFINGEAINMKVTDAVGVQSTNDAVSVGSNTYQFFGKLYPEINAQYIRTSGNTGYYLKFTLLDSDMKKTLAEANTDARRFNQGVQFDIESNNWWFWVWETEAKLEEVSGSNNSMRYDELHIFSFSTPKQVKLVQYQRTLYYDINYCKVILKPAVSVGRVSRKVYVYKNGRLLENSDGAYYHPSRLGYSIDNIELSYDSSKYVGSKQLTGDGVNYSVYLYSKGTLAYDANGGSGNKISETVVYGNSYTIKNNPFTRSGYEFLGWSRDPNATEADSTLKPGGSYKSTLDVSETDTLYAVWKLLPVTYTVEHYLQNESNTGYVDAATAYNNITYGPAESTQTITSYPNENLTYTPLSTLNSNEFVATPDAKCYIDGSVVDCSTKLQFGKTTVVKLYYKRQTYSVTYNYSNSVTGMPNLPTPKTYFSMADITVQKVTSPAGYTLQWYKDEQAINSGDAITDIVSDINIIGTWIPKNDGYYNIYYYLEGTTTSVRDTDVISGIEYGSKVSIEPPIVDGYTYTSSSTQPITVGYGTENIILYYKANPNTSYSVWYVEWDDNTIKKSFETVDRAGTTGTIPSYESKEFEGFRFIDYEIRILDNDGNITNQITDKILGSGKTVLLVKYERESYTVSWSITKEDDDSYKKEGVLTIKYEEFVTPELNKIIPEIENYEFSGWNETFDKMPARHITISGVMQRQKNNLKIIKNTPGISTYQIKDLNSGKIIDVLINGEKEAIITNLPIGNKIEITEYSTSIWSEIAPKKEITITENENVVSFTSSLLDLGWFRSEIFKRNIFGLIK